MKLKMLTLLLCFTFNFSHSSFAAVAVKKKEKTTVLESPSKKMPSVKPHKEWKWFQKKRKFKKRRFRLFDFLKWKKKKRKWKKEMEKVDNRKMDGAAVVSFIFTTSGILSVLFAPFNFFLGVFLLAFFLEVFSVF